MLYYHLNIALCRHKESVEYENVSVAMAVITPEEMNDTHMASTHFI